MHQTACDDHLYQRRLHLPRYRSTRMSKVRATSAAPTIPLERITVHLQAHTGEHSLGIDVDSDIMLGPISNTESSLDPSPINDHAGRDAEYGTMGKEGKLVL